MWISLMNYAEEDIYTGNNFKGASRYASTKTFLIGYIEIRGDNLCTWTRCSTTDSFMGSIANFVDLDQVYKYP